MPFRRWVSVSRSAIFLVSQMIARPLILHGPSTMSTLIFKCLSTVLSPHTHFRLSVSLFILRPVARLKHEFECIPAYIYDDTDNWSMNDFIDVRNGTFTKAINEMIERGEQHVYNCELCTAHGFICEYCADKQVIFPWQSRVSIFHTVSHTHTLAHTKRTHKIKMQTNKGHAIVLSIRLKLKIE